MKNLSIKIPGGNIGKTITRSPDGNGYIVKN